MSEVEQAAAFIRLKKESKKMQNEIAALEVEMKEASKSFAWLVERLYKCSGGTPDWPVYVQLISDLPKKIERYAELQSQKADADSQLSKFTDFD